MTRDQIQRKICEIVFKQLNSGGNRKVSGIEDIKMDSSFVVDLGADSLDVVDILTLVEEEFDVMIPDAFLDKIATVGQAVDYIEGAVSKHPVSEFETQ